MAAFALTYDDGPDPAWTPRLLAELRRRAATATFFVEARRAVAQRPLIEAMLEAGHEVGFHCLEHRRHSELSDSELAADTSAGLLLLDSLGVRPSSWRPPWGVVTAATRRLAAEHGLELCLWNVDSHDWRGDSCVHMREAIGGLRDGDVVLMHDGIGPGARREDCEQTLRLTAALLEDAAAAGLATVRVADLIAGADPAAVLR